MYIAFATGNNNLDDDPKSCAFLSDQMRVYMAKAEARRAAEESSSIRLLPDNPAAAGAAGGGEVVGGGAEDE